jgi:predicted TIM-barrel fold metal-dependent hydrolase
MSRVEVDAPNQWRLQSPGHAGWKRTARPDDPNKYVLISADCHANEPSNLWAERIDKKYRDRIPRVITDANGVMWRVSEGHRPDRLRVQDLEGEDMLRQKAGADPRDRLRDHARDGIDAEVIFPNKGLSMWATPDAVFAQAQCRVFNEWAWETFGPYNDRLSPVAAIATADLEGSIAEVQRVAKLGFRALTLPCKPVWGGHDVDHPNYNLPVFDPLWAVIQETGLPITFHVSTGRDPRASRGNGGAVINYVSTRCRRRSSPWPISAPRACSSAFPASGSRRSRRVSAGWRGCSTRWTRRTASTTSGCGRSSRSCRASITACTDSHRSRKTRPASTWPSVMASPTTSCGATTTRITRARGPIRRRPSSAP